MQNQVSDLTGLRILVVEDDLDSQILYAYVLEGAGAYLAIATSVGEALAILAQFTPDIVISDIALPDEDGYSLLRKLRTLEAESGQFLPAIAVSAYIQGNDDFLAIAADFQKWLPKPVDLDHFVSTIAQVAQHKTSDRCESNRKNPVC